MKPRPGILSRVQVKGAGFSGEIAAQAPSRLHRIRSAAHATEASQILSLFHATL
jgi:hypothetical protein